MKKTGIMIAVLLMMCLSACNMTGFLAGSEHQKENPQYFDSNVTTARVKAALLQEPSLRNNNVNVNTYHGQVQLSGFVDSKAEVKRAGRIAASIPGVLKVKNNLVVKK